MKNHYLPLFMVCLLSSSLAHAVMIDTVYVGNAGNANDSTGYGGVSYGYHISTYEVTNGQYAAFLNSVAATDSHGLYNAAMPGISRSGNSGHYTYTATSANTPVTYVSFWDAARFTNWLTSGNTETGVYQLNGVTNPTNTTIVRDATAWENGGVAIASEDEWYKAAYYDPTLNSGAGGYWLYPTQSNATPTAARPNGDDPNSANYDSVMVRVSEVGSYALASSYYGTFDQGGNVWEWNEAIIERLLPESSDRGVRGGSYYYSHAGDLVASGRNQFNPDFEINDLGFRISSLAPIPEPSTYAAIFGCLGLLMVWIRRKA